MALPDDIIFLVVYKFNNNNAGLAILSVTVVMSHAHAFLIGQKNGMFVRIMATTAIYQKVQNLLL